MPEHHLNWRGQFEDFRTHFLASAEFDGSASGDGNIIFGLVGIAPNPRFSDFHFKNAEIAQLNLIIPGQSLGNVIEGLLDHVKDLLLAQICFFADTRYKMPFRESHSFIWFLSYIHLT